MGSESSVVLNENVTTGAAVSVYVDGSSRAHQEVVIQTQTGSSDPVSVSTANALPVAASASSPLAVIGNVADGAADAGNSVKVAGVFNTSPPALSGGQRSALQVDSSGNLNVNIKAGAAAGGTSSTLGAAVPSTGTLALFSTGTVTAAALVDGSGNLKVNIAAGGVPAAQDNAAFTAGTTNGLGAFAVYNDGIGNLTSGNAGELRCTLDRKLLVAIGSSVSGGWVPFTYIGAATPAAQTVKSSAGQIGYMHVTNSDTNWVWVKIFNASPTLGTTSAVQNFGVPPGGGYTLPAPIAVGGSGIYIAVTGGIALNDDTGITASKTSVNLGYA
jgi:hypothetical protein